MEEFNDPGNRKVGEAKKYQEVVESKSQNSRQRPLLAALEEIMSTAASNAPSADGRTIKEYELQQVERANKTGLQPVVFVHGLWLLPSSWDRWAAVFEKLVIRHSHRAGRTTPRQSPKRTRIPKCSRTKPLVRLRTTSMRSSAR